MSGEGDGTHVIPEDDIIEHEAHYKCVCRPKWKAVWCEEHGVEWVFVHNAIDGREREEA